MPKDVVEQGMLERVVGALERLAGDAETLTGVEELSASMAGVTMAAPVGPAIEKLADAVNNVARAIQGLTSVQFMNQAAVGTPDVAGPDPTCIGPVDDPMVDYGQKTRKELRIVCNKLKIHTNAKMNRTKLLSLLAEHQG